MSLRYRATVSSSSLLLPDSLVMNRGVRYRADAASSVTLYDAAEQRGVI